MITKSMKDFHLAIFSGITEVTLFCVKVRKLYLFGNIAYFLITCPQLV